MGKQYWGFTMKREGILVLLSILLLPLNAAALTQIDYNFSTSDHDIWVEPLGSYAIYLDCEEGDYVSGEFEVVSGSDIDFFLFDEENYNKFIAREDSEAIRISHNVGSLTWSVYIVEDGRYYATYRNDNLFTRKHIEGSIEINSQSIPSLSLIAFLLALCIGGVVLCIICQRANQSQKQIQHDAQQGYQVRPTTQFIFCPYCGKGGLASGMRYCPSCGNQISTGTDLA